MTAVHLTDQFQLDDGAKVTFDKQSGYMTALPRVARTGIQLYTGREVGRPDLKVVRVYRPEDAVFHVDAMKSMAHKPITDDHPPVMVDASNWKQYGKGHTGDTTVRDGSFVRVPMMVSDGGLISKYKAGKAEISVGYGCEIEFKDGVTETGEAFDAVQSNIQVNHVAIVDNARGGQKLRLGDGAGAPVDQTTLAKIITAITDGRVNKTTALDGAAADATSLALNSTDTNYRFTKDGTVYTHGLPTARAIAAGMGHGDIVCAIDAILSFAADGAEPAPAKKEDPTMNDRTRTITVDGFSVAVGDARDEQIVLRALSDADKKVAKAEEEKEDFKKKFEKKDAETVTLTTDNAALTKEVAELKAKLADAAITPAMMDAAVAERTSVIAAAKALMPTVVVDGKTVADIRKQVVGSIVGDKAAKWNDDQMAASFDGLAARISTTDAGGGESRQLADSFRTQAPAGGHQQQNGKTSFVDANGQFDRSAFHADRARKQEAAWQTPNGQRAN